MHIHINLFEEEEERNHLFLILLGAGALLILLLFVLALWERSLLIDEKNRLMQDLEQYESHQQELQARTQSQGLTEQFELWRSVEEIRATTIPVDELVESFVSQLPERGFIQSFLYSPDGKVTLEVQFDSLQGVAFYTDALTDLTYINTVQLEEVLTEEVSTLEVSPRYITTYVVILDDQSEKVEVVVDEA